jgi:hypothetical protein
MVDRFLDNQNENHRMKQEVIKVMIDYVQKRICIKQKSMKTTTTTFLSRKKMMETICCLLLFTD